MLNQYDIDKIYQTIQKDGFCAIYYVAETTELREGFLDESHFKSAQRYKVVEVKITDIINAYHEYINYIRNKNNYHEESEVVYYDRDTKVTHYYTVPNGNKSYTKDLNPRMPSIIYGYIQRFIKDGIANAMVSKSLVKPIFTNALEYGDLKGNDITNAYNNGELDWKYITLDNKEIVDGIEYKYVTSKYYILTLENFPTIEKPLICTDQKSSFFTNIEDAFNFVDQLA